jgi:hypothetical protein
MEIWKHVHRFLTLYYLENFFSNACFSNGHWSGSIGKQRHGGRKIATEDLETFVTSTFETTYLRYIKFYTGSIELASLCRNKMTRRIFSLLLHFGECFAQKLQFISLEREKLFDTRDLTYPGWRVK